MKPSTSGGAPHRSKSAPPLCVSACALGVLLCTAPLRADITSTTIEASGSEPVKINACAAQYGSISTPSGIPFVNISEKDSDLVGASYDFTNVSNKPITAIRFTFRELDTFDEGPAYAVVVNDWKGVVAPGQSFRHNKAQGYNLTGRDVSHIVCRVQKVLFEDGSSWSAVGHEQSNAEPGLNYPPTPSPMI